MKRVLPIIILAVLLGVIISITFSPDLKTPALQEGQLRVHFLDVGQGDCALIQTDDGRNVLVDAGEADKAEAVTDYLVKNGVHRIDLLVITHAHSDHIGGLPVVLRRFGISEVLDAGLPHGSQAYADVLSIIESRRIAYRRASMGERLGVGSRLSLEVLWPPSDYSVSSEDMLNNGSVVFRIQFGEVSFSFTGDIEREAEGQLLASGQNLASTVLKVAHHGSDSSTSNEFLQVVQPAYAVISVGADNEYGHPARSTLRRLGAIGAKVFRTDEQGTIVVTTDGRTVEVITAR